MMEITVAELAKVLNLEYKGDGSTLIRHACGLESDRPFGISYIENERFYKKAMESSVEVLVCRETVELPEKTLIFADFPDLMIVEITHLLHPAKAFQKSTHSSSQIESDSFLGKDLFIGANVVIGHRTKIGSGTVIMAGTVIGDDCELGENCMIHPNVTVRDDSKIGDRVVINSGTVIGSEGFGFVSHDGLHHKIPQVGYVQIEDDVELGACNTIDRGRFGLTRIRRGSKTDNLVHIGHNVEIGEDSLIVGMVGFAGSTKTGHHLTMGGQSMLAGHLTIGDHVTVSAKSLLAKNVGNGERYSGIPARLHKEWLNAQGYLYRLQRIFEFFKQLKK
ncbi:MAG: UDP-3-O-(3-hydroxymyristoyl)glucosamine N-acyltransferase [SAR324 cluster bacterium]|nr:UDP-3-O-(3-hydroxymyristoyl)glucosamine N-acyltransferase [SAR324 cluster bacterium]